MTALLIGAAGHDVDAFARASREMLDQGLGAPRSVACGAARIAVFPGYGSDNDATSFVETDGGFIACAGTLFYRGLGGAKALRALWLDFVSPGAWTADDPWGNYALAIAKDGRLWLTGDRLGMVKLYTRPGEGLVSTSWLACVAAGRRSTLDRLGAIDYVLSGANHGLRTPIREVKILDPAMAMDAARRTDEDANTPLSTPTEWFAHAQPARLEDAIDEAVSLVKSRAVAICTAFDGKVRCALSGGFDSRLLFSAMRAAGVTPELHVYGRADDDDVRVASAVARTLRVALHHVDKRALSKTMPPLDADSLLERSRFFDGIPTDGIFDRGEDRDTRLRQSAAGAIALNGGGGEVMRNFFYLADRPYTVSQVVQTFYGNHDPAVARRPAELGEYRESLAESIGSQLGHGGMLTRNEVEGIYPLFRARFWTSRNNSLAARCGHFLTPLLDPALVRLALSLPLAWKDYGRFEGRLIAALDPILGALPLSYGFAPVDAPSRTYAAKMWLQNRRPPWLRARTVQFKRLAGRLPPPQASDDARKLVGHALRIDELLDLSRLADSAQLERALSLEFLLENWKIT